MTRLKEAIFTLVAILMALAAFGFFAGVGLVVLGAMVSLGLVLALASWLTSKRPGLKPDARL